MDLVSRSIQEYIRSGEYFTDARRWYKLKYVIPFAQRSTLSLLFYIFFSVLIGISMTLYSLLPIVKQVRYSINTSNEFQTTATVIKAKYLNSSPLATIAAIMAQDYVVQREQYNYDNLKRQFIFIKNTSTRWVYSRFYNFMNIDNSDSPVLKYTKDVKRDITISSYQYASSNEIMVYFRSVAKSNAGDITENKKWAAFITFDIDDIDLSLPLGSKFSFIVNSYRVRSDDK